MEEFLISLATESDRRCGCNLMKAYKLIQYVHIEDCTHILANFLKRIYEKHLLFEAFRKLIGEVRKSGFSVKKTANICLPVCEEKCGLLIFFLVLNRQKND